MKTRNQLKAEYKERKPAAGVYAIINTTSDQMLIDTASDTEAKLNRHRTELRFGSHRNNTLQTDWNDLGAEAFNFKTLALLKINEEEKVNIKEELQLLKEMVIEEMAKDDLKLY